MACIHRLLVADGFDDRVGAEPCGEVLDGGDAVVAAFGDDVGGPELTGEGLVLVEQPGELTAHLDYRSDEDSDMSTVTASRFTDKVGLVTGSGIDRSTALAFAAA